MPPIPSAGAAAAVDPRVQNLVDRLFPADRHHPKSPIRGMFQAVAEACLQRNPDAQVGSNFVPREVVARYQLLAAAYDKLGAMVESFERRPEYNDRRRMGARYFDGWNDPSRFEVRPGAGANEDVIVPKKRPLEPTIHIGSDAMIRDRCSAGAAACAVGVVPQANVYIAATGAHTTTISLLRGHGRGMRVEKRDEPLVLTFMHEYAHARFGLGESGARDVEAGPAGADLQEKLQNIFLKGYGPQEYVCSVIEHFRMRGAIYVQEGGKEKLNPQLASFLPGGADFRRMLVEIGNWSDRETSLSQSEKRAVNALVNSALKANYNGATEDLVRQYFVFRDEIEAVQWQPTGNATVDRLARAILPAGVAVQNAERETQKFMRLYREFQSGR